MSNRYTSFFEYMWQDRIDPIATGLPVTYLPCRYTFMQSNSYGTYPRRQRFLGDPVDLLNMAATIYANTPARAVKMARMGSLSTEVYNPTNQYVEFTNYRCVARNDISALDSTGAYVQNVFYQYLRGLAMNGYSVINNDAGATNGDANSDILTPFDSVSFCEVFKIVSVKRYRLMPGRTKTFFISRKKFRVVQPAKLVSSVAGSYLTQITNSNLNWSMLRGTVFDFFKIHSTLASKGAAAGVPSNIMTCNPGALNFAGKMKYHFAGLLGQAPITSFQASIHNYDNTQPASVPGAQYQLITGLNNQ